MRAQGHSGARPRGIPLAWAFGVNRSPGANGRTAEGCPEHIQPQTPLSLRPPSPFCLERESSGRGRGVGPLTGGTALSQRQRVAVTATCLRRPRRPRFSVSLGMWRPIPTMQDSEDTNSNFLEKMHKNVLKPLKRVQEINKLLIIMHIDKKPQPCLFKDSLTRRTRPFLRTFSLGVNGD